MAAHASSHLVSEEKRHMFAHAEIRITSVESDVHVGLADYDALERQPRATEEPLHQRAAKGQ